MSEPLLASLSDDELTQQGQNSLFLKEQALALLQELSHQDWTDHNTADPGITLLEVLSFAISDLSYRLSFSVPELLSPDLSREQWEPKPFYLAPDMLPSNMVTNADIRQAIIDIPGIKNANVLPGMQTAPDGKTQFAVSAVQLLLELQPQWALLPAEEYAPLLTQVRERFLSLRNVNQDLLGVQVLTPKPIAVRLALALEQVANPLEKVAEILLACQHIISPSIQQYTLQELQQQGINGDEIFNGPLPNNDFMKPEDLATVILPEWIYASDVLEGLQNIEGLQAIEGFHFISDNVFDASQNDSEKRYWRMQIPQGEVATFALDLSLHLLELNIDGQALALDDEAKAYIKDRIRKAEQVGDSSYQPQISDYIGDRYRQLSHYTSIQQDFPEIYKLNEQRIDLVTDTAAYAEILQLKGFLTLFDQVLADELAQLDNLRKLLAIPDHSVYQRLMSVFNTMLASEALSSQQIKLFWQDIAHLPHSQLSQAITDTSGMQHLLNDYFATYQQEGFQAYTEPVLSQTQLTRLTQSLDHLLARFAERRLDAGLLKYRAVFASYLSDFMPVPEHISQDTPLLDKLVSLKSLLDLTVLLNEYPSISQQRAGGINYLSLIDSQTKPAGLLHRIARFLGLSHIGEMPLAVTNRESLYLLESELLRHGADASSYLANQLYFIVPDWPTRFNNAAFRNLLTEQLRQQSPVHQQVYLVALPRLSMSLFERLYFCWLNAMTQTALPITASTEDNNNSAQTLTIPHSAHDEDFIARLSGYLREFIKQPNQLLQLVITTMSNDELVNPWQPLVDAINQWLDFASGPAIDGDSYDAIYTELEQFLQQQQTLYGGMDAKAVLFAIAHQHLDEMFNPHPISNATIGQDFRIGYQPLEYLQPSYPIITAYIHPGSDAKPNFTISIKEPRSI